jgi:hypothetical protein
MTFFTDTITRLSGVTLGALQGLNFALKRAEGHWEFTCASEAEVRK